MIKFIHKKHIKNDTETGKIIIYYSLSDILLGVLLFGLVVFFIQDYLSHTLGEERNKCISDFNLEQINYGTNK